MTNLNPVPDCIDLEQQPATPLLPNPSSIRVYNAGGQLAAIKSDGNSALPAAVPGGSTGDVQFNKGDGTFTNAAGIGAGSVAAMDSGGSFTLTGNGTFQFTAGNDVTFNLGRNFSLIGSGTVNFDTTNGGPSSASRISLLSAESIVLTALQDTAGQVQLNTNHVNIPNLQVFANNAAAISGGLGVGDLYRTGANPDVVCVVH